MSGATRSEAYEKFVRWANDYAEAARVRIKGNGGGGAGGTARWWRVLEDDVRCFLLTRQAGEDWERWMRVEWAALPPALRDCISIDARALRRSLEGCTWRA